MNKFAPVALIATGLVFAAVPAALHATETSQSVRAATDNSAPAVSAAAGKMIYGANGQRIAAIYRVSATGVVQIIIDGKLITVPSASLSEANGKITTTLTKSELVHQR